MFRRIVNQPFKRYNSTPSLANIEQRWTKLPEAEQGRIADELLAAQKGDWKKMTLEQKRAAYYIAYGPYGARAPPDPAVNQKVFGWVAGFCLLSAGVWVFFNQNYLPKLRTTTPEWIEAQKQKEEELQMNPYLSDWSKKKQQ